MQEELLSPLKMSETSTTFDDLIRSGNFFVPHLYQRKHFIEADHAVAYYAFASSSSFNSNLDDMLQFLKAELGEFPDVLSKQALNYMDQPRIT